MRKRLLIGLGLLVVAFGLCEGLSRLLLPSVDDCLDATRNPYRFRDWPAYVKGIERVPEGTATCVILSNSQGYSGEHPHYKTYPHWLHEALNARKAGGYEQWEVLNWSSDGMTSIELTALASYLASFNPTVVLALTGYADYAVEHGDQGFLYCRSDIPRLISASAVRRRLPGSYWARHGKVEDTLVTLLRDRFTCMRFREFGWSWLESRLPGVHRMFYAPGINYLPWDQPQRHLIRPLRRLPGERQDAVLHYDEISAEMMAEYMVALQAIQGRVAVIAQPARPSYLAAGVWREPFARDLAAATAAHDLPLHSLIDVLPEDAFISSSHFKVRYHRPFGERLADTIESLLADPPAPDA